MMKRALVSLLVPALLALLTAPVAAQQLDVQNFQPAVGPHGAWATEGARTVGHLIPTGGLLLNYSSRPLVVVETDDQGDEVISPIVDQQFGTHVIFGLGIAERLQLDVDLPIYLVNEGDIPVAFNQADVGDLRFRAKGRLYGEEEGFGLGLAADVSLPTGAASRYVGAPHVIFAPRLILDYDFGPLLIALNGGVRFREEGSFGNNVDLGNALTFGLAGEYEVMEGLVLVTADIFGRTSLADAFAGEDTPVEALVGAKLVASRGITIGGAAGGGIVTGARAPDFRMLVSLTWAPRDVDYDEDGIVNDEDECPAEPEDMDQFEDSDGCPEEDNDNDGLPDDVDQCDLSPEDADGFEDDDGCPDPDNDGDGINDDADECRDEAEDADGFEDEDGCPDLDNDGDGVPDADDKCPNEAEDGDGFQDDDGCPDLDNDRDEIPDVEDACPNEAGLLEDRGCPPKETKAVREKDRIRILDKVYFETGEAKIKEESNSLLKQVGLILRTNPDIVKVEIGGHTDYRGNDEKNLDLSQRRADAVKGWLVEFGIDGARLESVGYGEEKPVAEGRSKEANAKNRRVEFNILEQEGVSDESAADSDGERDDGEGNAANSDGEDADSDAPSESTDADGSEENVEPEGSNE